jgi:hypothetical protein
MLSGDERGRAVGYLPKVALVLLMIVTSCRAELKANEASDPTLSAPIDHGIDERWGKLVQYESSWPPKERAGDNIFLAQIIYECAGDGVELVVTPNLRAGEQHQAELDLMATQLLYDGPPLWHNRGVHKELKTDIIGRDCSTKEIFCVAIFTGDQSGRIGTQSTSLFHSWRIAIPRSLQDETRFELAGLKSGYWSMPYANPYHLFGIDSSKSLERELNFAPLTGYITITDNDGKVPRYAFIVLDQLVAGEPTRLRIKIDPERGIVAIGGLDLRQERLGRPGGLATCTLSSSKGLFAGVNLAAPKPDPVFR